MHSTIKIGIDIGGSHLSSSIIFQEHCDFTVLNLEKILIDSTISASSFINKIIEVLEKKIIDPSKKYTIGIAFPGPFDYFNGVCQIRSVGGKYNNLFGFNLKAALENKFKQKTKIFFANDAHCFAFGCKQYLGIVNEKTIYLTIGTGFGSSFMQNGKLIHEDDCIPNGGTFYRQPFKIGIADDYFSTRWFIGEAKLLTNKTFTSVKDIIDTDPALATKLFNLLCENLTSFLIPWLKEFNCEKLVIGGNIAKANHLFKTKFTDSLRLNDLETEVIFIDESEKMIMIGSAYISDDKIYLNHFPSSKFSSLQNKDNQLELRNTKQEILPLYSNKINTQTIYPKNIIENIIIDSGFQSLAKKLIGFSAIKIDGYGGVLWELFRAKLQDAFSSLGVDSHWYCFDSCLKDPNQLKSIISNSLNGDDPIFGKKYVGDIEDFFDHDKIKDFKTDPAFEMSIVYGTGSSLANISAPIIYIDVPKNEIQYRMRAGIVGNLGVTISPLHQQIYKQYYFIDWPILNKHKQRLLPIIDFIVDEQRINTITWMSGEHFRQSLFEISKKPFRARPWFESGIWGGQKLKTILPELRKDVLNYAWSFELITPENGIIISCDNLLLEVSFDFLMFYANENILGKATTKFGIEFPIRFDFLDTFDGNNLSIQCHPQKKYINEIFGENITQDETYYILDCEEGAEVYLGFQNSINKDSFKKELETAQKTGKIIDIDQFVQKFPSKKHDLFLIPNGTIHASGKNNLVLEISSTPYIFTFKMYDWQRLDVHGQPRPINIDHAFKNLNFERKGESVKKELLSKQQMICEFEGGHLVRLSTHTALFYEIERLSFLNEAIIYQNGQCKICMIVEGTSIEVIHNEQSYIYHYAETFVIPAAAGDIKFKNTGETQIKLLYAFVKDNHC